MKARIYLDVHNVTTFVHFQVRRQMCHSLLSELTGEHVPRAAADSFWVCHFAACNKQTKNSQQGQEKTGTTTKYRINIIFIQVNYSNYLLIQHTFLLSHSQYKYYGCKQLVWSSKKEIMHNPILR